MTACNACGEPIPADHYRQILPTGEQRHFRCARPSYGIERTWWANSVPTVIRFSHGDPDILAEAHFRLTAQLRAKKIGADIAEGIGYWQGASEPSYTATLYGASDSTVERLVTAVISAGCEAVQVERHPQVRLEEWRRADA